ncbi:MAG TPA: LytTR family DNA-binding domain-containing protein [Bacteroidota bacterium]|nr:LytTR family DNA-binding domain-containing protein [Bacteroidota bacterium]
MISSIIIDDEQSCIDRITDLLGRSHAGVIEVVASCRSVEEGIQAITAFRPQVVFLDVQINDRTGFDVLKLVPDVHFEVIFTTGFEKYAVEAFRFAAIDYLLKPVDQDDLRQAISRVQEKLSKQEMSKKLDVLFHNLKTLEGASKRITLPTLSGLVLVQVSDIVRCEADVNYTHIFLKNRQKMTVSRTLKDFADLLEDYNFYRVHNSHLVNLAHVVRYERGKGGFVAMIDGSQVEVSMRRKEEFLKRLSEI